MAQIVILGAGFGGVAAAAALRERLGAEHRIAVVDRRGEFLMGLRKLWMLTGRGARADGARPLTALGARGIEVVRAEITAIDPAARSVTTSAGTLDADYLVVALGAALNTAAVPGFERYNLYDADDVERAAGALDALTRGRIVIGILGVPYKCPPAPYEAAFLIDDLLRARGVRDAVQMDVFTPQPASLPVAGPAACAQVETTLALKGVGFHPKRAPARVEPDRVVFQDGSALAYDLLLAVPGHVCPRVVVESGLTEGKPWITPDRATLRTAFERVYAIGDVTQIPIAGGQMLPKAGVFAEAQGRVVSAQIAAEITGAPPAAFDGHGYCFLESGAGVAAFIRGNFFADPAPALEVTSPSPAAFAEKEAFERQRLHAWFGGAPRAMC